MGRLFGIILNKRYENMGDKLKVYLESSFINYLNLKRAIS